MPQCSQRRRCFFSAGEDGITADPCWLPVGSFPDLRSSDLEEEVQVKVEEEEVRALGSEEAKQPGVRVVIVLMRPWWGCGFGWWSTVGVGAA